MTAVYNEHDPFAAQWLRNLIAGGMIAPGDVDERSIEDVVPVEYANYTQVHLFAGIGVWSYSMRSAGWPDDRHGWSCSCPCQPFSQAGQGAGFADERHLWPAAFHLITQCGPDVVLGEQVASPDGFAWLDVVQNDMEATGHTFGAVVTPSAGYGAPHIRHRTYWVAYRNNGVENAELPTQPRQRFVGGASVRQQETVRFAGGSLADGLGQPHAYARLLPWENGGVANPFSGQLPQEGAGPYGGTGQPGIGQEFGRPGPINGFWRNVDWLRCKDARWRPVEPGTSPLVNGAPNRVGLLRGYGNAIVAPQAAEFIKIAMGYAP